MSGWVLGGAPEDGAANEPCAAAVHEERREGVGKKQLSCWGVPSAQVSRVLPLPDPMFSEVDSVKGKAYDAAARLSVPLGDAARLPWMGRVSAGEDGWMRAEPSFSPFCPTVRVFRFFVEPSAFVEGNLEVSCSQMCRVYVGGKQVAEKLARQPAGVKAGKVSPKVAWERRRYEVVVKVLSMPWDWTVPGVKADFVSEKPKQAVEVAFPDGYGRAPVTIEALNEAPRVSWCSVSPNGEYVLSRVERLLPDGKSQASFEVRRVADDAVVMVADDARRYRWMPRGARLMFTAMQGENVCAMKVYDVEKRSEEVLVEGLPFKDVSYAWAPDESFLVATVTERFEEKGKEKDFKRFVNMADRDPKWRDRSFLYLVDRDSGRMRRLTAGVGNAELCDVSPDGSKVLFAVSRVDYSKRRYAVNDLWMLDPRSMACEALLRDVPFSVSSASWSPDGRKILIVSAPDAFDGVGLNLPEGYVANGFDRQAFLFDVESRQAEPITRKFTPSVVSGMWGGDGRVYLGVIEGDVNAVYAYDPAAASFSRVEVPDVSAGAFSIPRCREGFRPVMAVLGQSMQSPSRLYVGDLSSGTFRCVSDPAAAHMAKWELPKVEKWEFTNSEGSRIDGFYVLPVHMEEGRKYPMITYFYGGTNPSKQVFNAHYPALLYAAQGYVVYVPQPSGAIGYGQAFSALHVNGWGKRNAQDIIEGVKRFCEEHAFVDAAHVGCIGASYGGYMSMFLQSQTDLFAAAVSHAGISDLSGYWGGGLWGYAYNADAAAGSMPWSESGLFVEQSPLYAAEKMNTPLLLVHGDADRNVPVNESMKMFTALKLLGKPVELVTFKGEDHFILDYKRRKQWMKSHLAWFDRWLKEDADWWNALYPEKDSW